MSAHRRSRLIAGIAAPLLILCAVAFFAFQIYTGEFGRIALEDAELRRDALTRDVAALEVLRDAEKARNRALRADSLDLDLLDERARDVLGYIGEDEVFLVEPGSD